MGSSSSTNTVPAKWDAAQIPSLASKVVIITGANSGIGYVAALEMAKHGAHVVLACRNEERGKEAQRKIQNELFANAQANVRGGSAEFMQLDVGSLSSVSAFVETFQSTHDRLDVLVNNAGIFGVPYTLSPDGIESQFATNHLGHFALTSQLYGLLKKSAPSRIINTSSVVHRDAKFNVNEIVTPQSKYKSLEVYANTKLCNLLFTAEMDRRLRSKHVDGVIVVTAHPGLTDTNIFGGPGQSTSKTERFMKMLAGWMSQYVEMGALPTLYAATAPGVRGGEYYGPNGFNNVRGYPGLEEPKNDSKSTDAAEKLWQVSERLAKLSFEI